jgi:hypothetical protein
VTDTISKELKGKINIIRVDIGSLFGSEAMTAF